MSRAKKPSLAELYAGTAEGADRERWHANEVPRYAESAPYPRPPAGDVTTVWVTKPILRTRGWTDAAVRDFLPEPERHQDNPHPGGAGRPMPLWSAATVGRAEATVAWQTWLRQSLRRRSRNLDDLFDTPDTPFRRRAEAAHAAITASQRADAARLGPDVHGA